MGQSELSEPSYYKMPQVSLQKEPRMEGGCLYTKEFAAYKLSAALYAQTDCIGE